MSIILKIVEDNRVKFVFYIVLLALWCVYGANNSAEPPYVGF